MWPGVTCGHNAAHIPCSSQRCMFGYSWLVMLDCMWRKGAHVVTQICWYCACALCSDSQSVLTLLMTVQRRGLQPTRLQMTCKPAKSSMTWHLTLLLRRLQTSKDWRCQSQKSPCLSNRMHSIRKWNQLETRTKCMCPMLNKYRIWAMLL